MIWIICSYLLLGVFFAAHFDNSFFSRWAQETERGQVVRAIACVFVVFLWPVILFLYFKELSKVHRG